MRSGLLLVKCHKPVHPRYLKEIRAVFSRMKRVWKTHKNRKDRSSSFYNNVQRTPDVTSAIDIRSCKICNGCLFAWLRSLSITSSEVSTEIFALTTIIHKLVFILLYIYVHAYIVLSIFTYDRKLYLKWYLKLPLNY